MRQQRTFCLKNSRIRLYISGGVNYNVSVTDFFACILYWNCTCKKQKKNHVILKFEHDSSILIIYKYNLF